MRIFSLTVISLLLASHVWGLNLEPLSMQFKPEGRQSIRTFRVSNTHKNSIAVRISMTTRELMPDGTEKRSPADSEFTVFPDRLFIAPGQSQAVRVQWKGESSLTQEKSYRIIAEQLPVQDITSGTGQDEGGISLSFLYKYVGSVYITPDNAKEDIVISGAAENSKYILKFENRGSAHAVMEDAEITLIARPAGGNEIRHRIEYKDLKILPGINFLAGASLIEEITLPMNMQNQNIVVEYSFKTTQ
jgi:fimbrial chaperone protein